jgi:hypothetical protein
VAQNMEANKEGQRVTLDNLDEVYILLNLYINFDRILIAMAKNEKNDCRRKRSQLEDILGKTRNDILFERNYTRIVEIQSRMRIGYVG